MKALLFASCLTLAVLPMCKPDASKTTTDVAVASPASPAEVRAQFASLRDSAAANWQRMMASDDQKLRDLHGLLDDLRQVPALDKQQLATLRQAADRLPKQRYDRQTMTSSALIDRYDAVQDSVLKAVYPLATPEGNAPTAAVRNYVEAIQAADGNVVAYRAHYDVAAKAYNAYLQVHGTELTKLGGKYTGLQPLPLFELSH
ncbi:MAG: hypothetical protein ACRYFK_20725 [Janthinobacterium lividum]